MATLYTASLLSSDSILPLPSGGTNGNYLYSFDSDSPSTLTLIGKINSVTNREFNDLAIGQGRLLGIFINSSSRNSTIYDINLSTGAGTDLGNINAPPSSRTTSISGIAYGNGAWYATTINTEEIYTFNPSSLSPSSTITLSNKVADISHFLFNDRINLLTYAAGYRFIGNSTERKLIKLNKNFGGQVNYNISFVPEGLSVLNNRLYALDISYNLHRLNPDSPTDTSAPFGIIGRVGNLTFTRGQTGISGLAGQPVFTKLYTAFGFPVTTLYKGETRVKRLFKGSDMIFESL